MSWMTVVLRGDHRFTHWIELCDVFPVVPANGCLGGSLDGLSRKLCFC